MYIRERRLRSDTKYAFVTSVERSYGQRLRRFVSARLRNAAADTPDLMQEVYLRLLRIDDHEAIRNPQAYLFTIASHVLHQHALRQSAALESLSLTGDEPALQARTDPATEVETEQAFEELGRSLQQLSPKAYATLILSRCEGLPLQQIGERLGVSRDQVKKYLARALIHVRKGLTEMNGGKT
jgi:RNA polymerase sigma factor (sigma-70 family)